MSVLGNLNKPLSLRTRGFTLVELLVVIAIIAILASFIVGSSSLAGKKADKSKALAALQKWQNAMEEYRVKAGACPKSSGELAVTNMAFAGAVSSVLERVDKDLLVELDYYDPWGNPYMYQRDSQSKFSYRLWSKGPRKNDSGDDISPSSGGF